MTGERDAAQELIELAQEILQQGEMLILRVRNLTGSLNSGEYAEYLGSFDRIQKLFDKFSTDFRDAGFPDDQEIREARKKLSDCFQEFFRVRTGFFNQYAAQSAEPDRQPILENTPEETEKGVENDAGEQDAEETTDAGAEPKEDPEAPEDGKQKKKRKVKKPLPPSEQVRQEAQRAEAARMGMPVRPDQPITEADLRNAQYRLDEERRRKEAAAAENIRRENEKLAAYRERMAQSAAFQHLENSHIDMSREGIGKSHSVQGKQSGDTRSGSESQSGTDHSQQRYQLSKITTNLGAVSYVAFSAAAQKTAQEASKESDVASTLLSASYYVPAAAGLAWASTHKPTKPLERSARWVTPDELSRQCSENLRRYKDLKIQSSNLEKQLAALTGTDKRTIQRRNQLLAQQSALKSQLLAGEKAAAQSRRLQNFQHERALDREIMDQLKVKGKLPKGAKAIGERSQGILQKDNRALVKKYGSLSGLSEREIRNRVQRLTMEGKAQRLRIRQLESKGASLSSAERQLITKLKARNGELGKEISSLVGLSKAKSDLAYKGTKLSAIMKTANKRYMYRLNGMRLMRSFALRPLYAGQDSNTEGLAYMAQTAMDPTTRHITKAAVKLPFRATGKVVRRVAPEFAHKVQVKYHTVKTKVVTAPRRLVTWGAKKAGTAISSAVPIEVKTKVASSIHYVKGKYNAVRTAYTGAKKWLAGTRVGKAWTNVRIFKLRLSKAGHMALGFLKKGLLAGLGIYLALVLVIGVIGLILPTTASSSCLILSTAPSNTGKINLSPYCQILRMEKIRYDDMIAQLVKKYEEDDNYDNVTLRHSGADNLREILSMMAVRLRQELDTSSNPNVQSYLEELYRSSRQYTVSEHKYTCSGCKTKYIYKIIVDPATGEPTLQVTPELYCPGHTDVTIQVTVLTFDEIFAADTYTIPDDGWEGWTEDNIAWCKAIYDMDWAELYEGVSLSAAPLFGSLEISENERQIWDYLLALTGNPYGAAGLMGNLYERSGLRSDNLQDTYEPLVGYDDTSYTQAVDNGTYQNFTSDNAGYGLAQWSSSERKEKLLAFAQAQGKTVGDLSVQLQFLSRELAGSPILEALRSAGSVREASDKVLTLFDKPGDLSEAAQLRRERLAGYYYNTFVYGINAEGVLTEKQLNVIRVATNSESYHIRAESGFCQRWAAQVYAVAGMPLDGSSSAYRSGIRYGVSDDWGTIPPGAAVYGYSGGEFGHVGIYVGNGLVYHNIGGVAVHSLSKWVQLYDGFCWGWEAGADLTLPD